MADDGLRNHLIGKMTRLKAGAEEILNENEKMGREETDEQAAEIKKITEEIVAIQLEVKKIDDRDEMRRSLEALGTVSDTATTDTSPVEAKTIGEALAMSPEYKALVASAKMDGGKIPRFTLVSEVKAVGDAILGTTGNNSDAIQPTWDPTLRAPGLFQFPLRVADLLTVSQVENGPTITYPKVVTRTAPSGNPTAEGAAKKGVEFAFDVGTATLVNNTAFTGFSDEFFQDAPRLVAYINSQLGLMVQQDEESAIVAALFAATTQTADGSEVGGDNVFDAIRAAMAQIYLAGGVPDAILLHPNDAAYMDTRRAVAGDGAYFSGGPRGGPVDAWWGGLRLVQTPSIDESTALVGAFKLGATLYRKGGLRVESTNSHDDWFRSDKVAVRAQLRSVACVHNPELFVEVDTGFSS